MAGAHFYETNAIRIHTELSVMGTVNGEAFLQDYPMVAWPINLELDTRYMGHMDESDVEEASAGGNNAWSPLANTDFPVPRPPAMITPPSRGSTAESMSANFSVP